MKYYPKGLQNEMSKERDRLTAYSAERANLADTVAKLKDEDVDFEITKENGLYQPNRQTVGRFRFVFFCSKSYYQD